MASTLQNIRTSVNFNILPLPISKIWYGFNDQINVTEEPFATVTDFKQVPEYDTAGVRYRESTFNLHVFANKLESAEALAIGIDDQINNTALTGDGSRLLQQSYEVAQEDLYVFHVVMAYKLFETL